MNCPYHSVSNIFLMKATNEEQKWMGRAIRLAQKGIAGASPNPLVGCVIIKDGKILGEGYHEFFGGPHAEVNALKDAGKKSKNATLYVNLEPCCHWGKTPPCTDAIIKAGISKVVAAMPDPNPLVAGKGFKKLISAGITVNVGALKNEAKDLNRSFLKFASRKVPFVSLKSAMSIDGKIATCSGESKWITSEVSRKFSRRLRSEADAILVGAQTVRRDDPELTSHGSGRDPIRVVISGSGKLPAKSKIFSRAAETWLILGNPGKDKDDDIQAGSGVRRIYLRSKNGRMDFKDILRKLGSRGISRLLIEGGGETAANALGSGEVDEIYFFIAPVILGGRDAKTPVEGAGVKNIADAFRLKNVNVHRLGEDILVHARISKSFTRT